jgi:hypothetical protein
MIGIDRVRPGGRRGGWMTTVIEHIDGHYETQSMSYGQAYVWCPECVVVECDCGETPILTSSESVCRCGTDHEALVRETTALGQPSVEAPHPWDHEYREWQDEFLRSERLYQQELSGLD